VKAKVAVVTESFLPQINGVTNSVLRILETFKQKEIQAKVISPTRQSSHHLGFEVQALPSVPVMQFPVALPTPAISRALDEFQPDVVHVAAPFLIGAQALAWANRNAVPSVAIYQTDVAGYLERYNLSFARPVMDMITSAIHTQATINLAPTQEGANYLRSIGVERVDIWGRGVDQDLFNPLHKQSVQVQRIRASIARERELVIGFVGRLAAEKQVHRMLELLDIPNAKFLIVGDGPEREKLEQLFAQKPVTFTGALTGLDLAYHYAAMDIFVHFGTEETFGQTIQEAQAAGLAVVAPDRGGPRYLIDHGHTGLLVDPEQPKGYLKAVLSLLSAERRDQIIANSLAAVSNKSWSTNNAKLLDFYRQAITTVYTRRANEFELA
jgi:phosphatidylinositol alpha 1,6-mannosyltransferase